MITQYDVLKGNPVDEVHVAPSLRRHRRAFRRAPQLYGADRGFFSERNVTVCVHGGVAMVSIPQRGGSKTPQRQDHERSPAFKQGQRFRARIEGRISVLKRGRAEGAKRFAVFVGAAVLANKLMIIAALLMKERSRRRKATRKPCSRCRARNQLRLADAGPAKNGAKTLANSAATVAYSETWGFLDQRQVRVP